MKLDVEDKYDLGSTDFGSLVPRERFSYWCFDLLFLICSETTKGAFSLAPQLMPLSEVFGQTKKVLGSDWRR